MFDPPALPVDILKQDASNIITAWLSVKGCLVFVHSSGPHQAHLHPALGPGAVLPLVAGSGGAGLPLLHLGGARPAVPLGGLDHRPLAPHLPWTKNTRRDIVSTGTPQSYGTQMLRGRRVRSKNVSCALFPIVGSLFPSRRRQAVKVSGRAGGSEALVVEKEGINEFRRAELMGGI